MIDLKTFRKVNKLKQNDVADYLGVSFGFISQIERGERKLSAAIVERLTNNDRGWVVPDGAMVAEPQAPYGTSAQNWPSIVADLSAKIGEQNSQIDRLLSIVEQLTSQKK